MPFESTNFNPTLQRTLNSKFRSEGFLIDFLGGLLPGVLFLVGAFTALIAPTHSLHLTFSNQLEVKNLEQSEKSFSDQSEIKSPKVIYYFLDDFTNFLNSVKGTPGIIWFGLLILFFILAYFLGLTFFRRDPKDVDIESFKFIMDKFFREPMPGSISKKLNYIPLFRFFKTIWELFEERDFNKNLIEEIEKGVKIFLKEDSKIHNQKRFFQIFIEKFSSEGIFIKNISEKIDLNKEKLNKKFIETIRNKLLKSSDDLTTFRGMINDPTIKEWINENNAKEWSEKTNLLIEFGIIEKIKQLLRSNFGSDDEDEVEYPYIYLGDYLKKRGLDYLLIFVNWEENKSFRSKTYINILKMRLMFNQSERIGNIIRNEAHIRLASTAWYVAKILLVLSDIGFIICIIGLFAYLNLSHEFLSVFVYFNVFAGPALVYFISHYSIRSIEKFFLYQRLREIVYVLETAYTAFNNTPNFPGKPFSKN